MALVVLLKGINVGGHRTVRPSELAKSLSRFEVVNIGAAGTFVIRKKIAQSELRKEIARRLPFEAQIMICSGADVLRFTARDWFAAYPVRPDIIQFVSVLAKNRPPSSTIPIDLPGDGRWSLRILGQEGRFVFGLHRREMKAIGYLGQLEKLFGVPATTRSWSTLLQIARILGS
jgi:uncharacterized protein (DUF1697 family)